MKNLILASKSQDRTLLFKNAKLNFEIFVTNVNEEEYKLKILDPIELVKKLAEAKLINAKYFLAETRPKGSIIIAADTIVEFNGKIIGKAKDETQAFKILKELSANKHNLITGIAISEIGNSKIIIDHDITSVKFLDLSDNAILSYIKSEEWRGRAGAYSIREKASLFIKSIEGSSTNVIGLPMQKVFTILKDEFNTNLL